LNQSDRKEDSETENSDDCADAYDESEGASKNGAKVLTQKKKERYQR
jgi:hypothetical protein